MPRGAELVLAALSLLVWADGARAQPGPTPKPRPGKQEESRRKLLEQVGLDKQPGTPAKPSEPPPEQQEPAPAPTPPTGSPPGPAAGTTAPPAAITFTGRVHQALLASCRPCHAAGGMAAATRLVLDGNAARDHAAARKLVDPAAPRRSLLLTKATGNQHGGGPTLTTGSDSYRRLLQWIGNGAQLDARPAGESPAPPAVASGTATPPRPRVRAPSAVPPVPTAPVPAAPELPAPAVEEVAPAEAPAAAGATTAPVPAAAALAPEAIALHAELGRACQPCHREGGPAGMTRYKLGGLLEADLGASRAFVDTGNPSASPLVSKAAGQPHGGGVVWAPGSRGQKALLAWIAAGAPDRPPTPEATAAAPAPAAPTGAPAPAAASLPPAAAAPSPAAGHHPPRASLTLFGNQLTLNGRFDLNLERRAFEANPWADGSKRALQSYHHFVFLGRQAADDPFVFTAELLSLEFYEAGFRLGRGRHWGAHVRAGKLLVPFGNEPLFHQSYGGSAGFDQRVLPAIWAAEGLAASGHLELSGATLSADLYGVRGYALRRADAVLNLQSDLSPVDDVRPALGARLGAAFGALTGFYSAYFNPLGFDRRLFLQAIDLSVWRWREIPVLDRLVLAMGLLRADVSGGGAGADYYHFASYWMARVYAVDWLYLQYRQGLRTFDNKRNLTYDARRAGREDGSTHNITLGTRYRGLTAGLSYFLNFEKADEVDDDLLRLWVAFEF